MAEDIPLGFDGISGDEGRSSPTDYTVQFTPSAAATEPESKPAAGAMDEVGLLETPKLETTEEEKVCSCVHSSSHQLCWVWHFMLEQLS